MINYKRYFTRFHLVKNLNHSEPIVSKKTTTQRISLLSMCYITFIDKHEIPYRSNPSV